MPRLLITGASGFIGRELLSLFSNWEVHAVKRSNRLTLDKSLTHWHSVDLFDTQMVEKLIQEIKPSHLLHLAWEARPNVYWTSLDNYRWVGASLALLNSFQRHGGERVVIAGTCAEYEWHSGSFLENEGHLNFSNPYSASKSSLFHLARSFAKQTELSLAWGRIFFPYGPGEYPERMIPTMIRSFLAQKGFEIQNPGQIRDFLHVRDVAQAFSVIVQSEFQGPVNIGSGEGISLKKVAELIADHLNTHHLLKINSLSTDSSSVIADSTALHEHLTWKPQYSLTTGLMNTIQWWQLQKENFS